MVFSELYNGSKSQKLTLRGMSLDKKYQFLTILLQKKSRTNAHQMHVSEYAPSQLTFWIFAS
jgi:hypothetical protein